jgi:hypothetical protein
MAILMISSMYQGGGDELALALSRKTGWPLIDRENLLEQARQSGIKVGRLEMSAIKKPRASEKLAREKELFVALETSVLCEKAREGNLIYSGRAGHLLLPGVSHRLRVGLTAPRDVRIERTARALRLTPERAENYLLQLDEDVENWIRYVHGHDGRDPNHFDAFFNLENLGLSNAAGILCEMAELPDFQPTPASRRIVDDHYLSAVARLHLARNENTQRADLQVQASGGVITVTYPPQQKQISQFIPAALEGLPGCREIQCTMAETNILWVQERFAPDAGNFNQILRLAQRWGAAVELMRLIPGGEMAADLEETPGESGAGFGRKDCPIDDGGVEEDGPEVKADGGLSRTEEKLVELGRFGGRQSVCGGHDKILERVQGGGRYSLVVIGDMFLSKGHSTRTRRTREMAMSIRDRLKAPVITGDELKARFLFGKRQAFTLVGFLALVVLIYSVVFTHQQPVMNFLSGPIHQHTKWIASVAVVLFIPLIAYLYGTVTGLALKIINVD